MTGLTIPIGVQSYRRADLPQIVLRNLYVEQTPATPEKTVFLPRPALSPLRVVGSGPTRGMFSQAGVFDGDLFVVSGAGLFRGDAEIGTIGGSDAVNMVVADNALLAASGGPLYRYDGASTTQIAFPDDAGVGAIAYLAGYAVAARAGTRRLYFTLDTMVWADLDYLSATQTSAPIVGLAVVSGQLWVLCADHIEIFVPTGIPDTPFQALEGRSYLRGVRDARTIVIFDNTVAWVGDDGIVYRGDAVPLRISDHGIEERIAASGELAAWAFTWAGHSFYALHTDDGSFLYDAATKQWTEVHSRSRARWRAVTGLRVGPGIVAGDDQTGQLWQLADGVYRDGTAEIERVFTVQIDRSGFVDTIALDMSVAQGGLVEMRTSRDQGVTWQDWRQFALGAVGRYRTEPRFNRLGMADGMGMLIQFRITDNAPSRVTSVRVNEPQGGRAR